MAIFNKFDSFVEALAEKQHNLQSDTLRVMLTNTAPVRTNAVKADIVEIAAGGGYAAGGPQVPVSSSAQTAGTYKLVAADTPITNQAGSTIGPFRYAVFYNATSGLLISWWDYAVPTTLGQSGSGETFTVVFSDNGGTVLNLA